jgi:hypothetical protein
MDNRIRQIHLSAARLSGEKRSCTGKIDYKSEASAEKAARKLNESGKAHHKLEHYPCPFCGGWHIGRVHKP